MASFEDYDEFGNYIGADLDSDDEEEAPQNDFVQQQQQQQQPLEGFDEDEPMQAPDETGTALMQIDGAHITTSLVISPHPCTLQNLCTMRSFCMRISSTTRQLRKSTAKT